MLQLNILGRLIRNDISGRNYGTSIFGRKVRFGRSVQPSGCLFSAVQLLFIQPSGFGRLGHTRLLRTHLRKIQVLMPSKKKSGNSVGKAVCARQPAAGLPF